MPLPPRTVVAMNRWLRTRAAARSRPAPNQGPLWIAQRGGQRLGEAGIYLMLRRRVEQAGYDPGTVHPHLFRHTAAHQFLADGGSEGDLMQLMGWKDAEMTHRYGRSAAQERAVLYAARHGFGEPKLR
jgi:site-specific recombinase XerD